MKFLGIPATVLVVVAFVLRAEYPDLGRRIARRAIRWSAMALPSGAREVREQEWLAELAAIPQETGGRSTGLGFALAIAGRYLLFDPVKREFEPRMALVMAMQGAFFFAHGGVLEALAISAAFGSAFGLWFAITDVFFNI